MPYVLPAVKQFLAVDGSGEVPPIGESSTSFPAISLSTTLMWFVC